jgi:DNA mismatch repair protein MutS
MQTFSTPMMKQYVQIKSEYPDCLLLFRLGDFYELFLEDAQIGAQVLDITLTARPEGRDGKVPMAGVPYHALDSYLSKLVKAGYKVAICEQVSEPNSKGIVDREVVRVVTPGTVMDEKALERKENNYIMSLSLDGTCFALAVADISTGHFETNQVVYSDLEQSLKDELSRINPSECILPPDLYNNPEIIRILKTQRTLTIYPYADWRSFSNEQVLKKHFGVSTLESFGIANKKLCIESCAALLSYLKNTQKGKISHIKKIATHEDDTFVSLDRSTIVNLELFSTIRERDTRATLLSVIDRTQTAMGGRLLKQWMCFPLRQKEPITKRLDAVEELLEDSNLRSDLLELLQKIPDVERLLSRVSVGIGNARDIVNLKESLKKILEAKHCLVKTNSILLQEIQSAITTDLLACIHLIEHTFVEEPPIVIKDGGMIKEGVLPKLDKLKEIAGKGRNWILSLEKDEKKATGISTLKIRFNKVFGFYIEVSRGSTHLVPAYYIRKQTIVNGERYITPDLKKREEEIFIAEEEAKLLEYKIFQETQSNVLKFTEEIQNATQAIAQLDCLLSFAEMAEINNYTCPRMLYSNELRIKKGRHPVVEELVTQHNFVPNDVTINSINQSLLLITGPNMAGKSVFLRQIAIIVLLAQMGSFVPAKSAHIGITDKIFVRSGASDAVSSGLSTFMVEMVETAYILHNATKNSLIIMDEIGRGTSTYDGISIAWAVAEYLVTHLPTPPKTLFATHYHELQELEKLFPKKIKNYHMAIAQDNDAPVFLYTLLPEGASHSFGVAVAKLAGVPEEVIKKAGKMLDSLENKQSLDLQSQESRIKNQGGNGNNKLAKELTKIDVNRLTPIEALNVLSRLKEL